jgi:gliding motility-associated-like protein
MKTLFTLKNTHRIVLSFTKASRLTVLGLLCTYLAQSQSSHVPSFVSSTDVFGTRSFIENKGQFTLPSGEKILYAYESGAEKVFFTEQGPIYQLEKMEPLKEWQREAMERGKDPQLKPTEVHYVKVNWTNQSSSSSLQAENKRPHYFTYGDKSLNAASFEKITYKNVYPNIDIEYSFPKEQSHGLKYSIIARPGAQVADIQIVYSGEIGKMKLNDDGSISLRTTLDDIIEHRPVSFDSDGQTVKSKFVLKDKIISFAFPDGYDVTKTLIIDPWVTTITGLTTNNYGYDVDYDFSGNVYVYGGYNPFKVSQYNSSGVLIWTFAGTVAGPGWSTAPILSQASNFAVNKYNSKTYIGQGFVFNGNRVIRLDAAGNYDNFINTANGNFQEVWEMGFHCVTGEVFVLGGGTSANISAVTINPTTAVINLTTFQPSNNSIAQDVVSHAIDDAGNIFIIYAGGSLTNKLCRINAAFNNNVWTQPSTFNSFSEQGNKNQYQWSGSLSSNGFNCLAVNANYLYYYDGFNLSSYNKTTGALVAATTIPALTLKRQGGIAVDDCDNVYLGGNGSILVYSFNGTAFTALNPIPLAATTPSTYVYDLKIDKGNKILYASGSGFVGVYSPVNTLACPTASSSCFFYVPQDFTVCAGAAVTLSMSNTSSLMNVSFSIQPTGITNTTGTFVLTPSVTTAYTMYVTGTNLGNVVVTNTAVSTVSVFAQPSTVPTTTQSTCTSTLNGFNLGLSFFPSSPIPNYSILWSTLPGTVTSTTQFSALGGIQPGVFTATVTTNNGCKSVAVFSINPLPEPATFTRSPGGNYVLDCYQPVVTTSYAPSTLNYTTSSNIMSAINGAQVSLTYSNSGSVITVLSQHPISGCVSSQTFIVITNTAVPNVTLTPLTQNITCSLSSVITVTAIGSLSTNAQHNWSSPFGGTLAVNSPSSYYVPGGPGIYVDCFQDLANGCSTCKNITVTSSSGFPTFSVVSPQNFTLGCNTHSFAIINIVGAQTTPPAGSVSYTLLGPSSSTNYVPIGISNFTVTQPGTWTVVTKDNTNQCETKFPLSILQNTFAPDVDATVPLSMLTCAQPTVLLTAVTSVTNMTYNWALPGTQGNIAAQSITVGANFQALTNTVTGTYTITIKNVDNDCIGSKTILINQNLFAPSPVISGLGAITCNTPTLTLTNLSTTKIPPALNPSKPVVASVWSGPTPQEPVLLNSTYVAYIPGTFTLFVTDLNNGCTAVATKTIDDARDYPPLKNPAHKPVVLECGANSVSITPDMDVKSGYSYSWTAASGATIGVSDKPVLTANLIGTYWVTVTTASNGCASAGYIDIVSDSLQASFIAEPMTGFAPLQVKFTNTSSSLSNFANVFGNWSAGNGKTFTTTSAVSTGTALYTHPGTYTVVLYANKGVCLDTAVRLIRVELPSALEVPNIFSPNGDGVNDVFFLHATNLTEIKMQITDRWGGTVYELNSSTGNVSWDGMNQMGKEAPDGVYLYTLKTMGSDGAVHDQHGTITLVR